MNEEISKTFPNGEQFKVAFDSLDGLIKPIKYNRYKENIIRKNSVKMIIPALQPGT